METKHWLLLSKGQKARVDEHDLQKLSKHKWHAKVHSNGVEYGYYAGASIYQKSRIPKKLSMHRYLLGVTDPLIHVDHENNDTLDNRQENLRKTTRNQNMQNRKGPHKNNITGIRGVHVFKDSRTKKISGYRAVIKSKDHGTANKLFPYTDQGLLDAEAWVLAKRLEVFTHSDGR